MQNDEKNLFLNFYFHYHTKIYRLNCNYFNNYIINIILYYNKMNN